MEGAAVEFDTLLAWPDVPESRNCIVTTATTHIRMRVVIVTRRRWDICISCTRLQSPPAAAISNASPSNYA